MDERMERHLQLVIAANETLNLTRIQTPESGRILHIEDSLSAMPEMRAAPDGRYADLGSGAGFPGIPLAIETGRKTILVESVKKKAKYLAEFAKELEIDDFVSIYDGRIEQLSREQPNSFAVVTARALSSLGSLLELASPLLVKGGHLICYKARMDKDEFTHACSLEKKTGMKFVSQREFYLSDEQTYRRIVVFEKAAKPNIKLPRREGQAQRNPL